MQGHNDRLYESLVEDAFEFIVTIGPDLTLGYANQALARLLGHAPDDVVGRSSADFVHPDDLDRALSAVTGWERWGAPAGATSFRLRHADGSWLTFDVTAATVDDGERAYFAVYCRPADYQHATDAVLRLLLTGADRAEALAPVVDLFEWKLNDVHIAVAWYEPGAGHRCVSTGLPAALTGAEDDPGAAWVQARERLAAVHDPDLSTLDPDRRALAATYGRGGFWVEPVVDVTSGVPALVTVWTRAGGPPAAGHAFGMAQARVYVELILRWTHQVARLSAAAHTDPLTGLPNRRAFFDLLDQAKSGGALLFCDLDQFKPINDALGHHVGDELLRQVAARLSATVRGNDVVARTGGDEFVVLARGASANQARDLVDRLCEAMIEPFDVDGTAVMVGITIGVAHTLDRLTELTLAEADRALLEAKAARRRHHARPAD